MIASIFGASSFPSSTHHLNCNPDARCASYLGILSIFLTVWINYSCHLFGWCNTQRNGNSSRLFCKINPLLDKNLVICINLCNVIYTDSGTEFKWEYNTFLIQKQVGGRVLERWKVHCNFKLIGRLLYKHLLRYSKSSYCYSPFTAKINHFSSRKKAMKLYKKKHWRFI